ncbi:lysophospholipid acyltransferase family protein [Dasania marina]|uniref:lysophospholipid acyltransferase family protein n=1 Tax=Dasania marina TaxID=471499 RepID=UPI0030D90061|tara:strand:- start:35229 stop:35960 length:732 start_codon:yes stop_codon:yes gene_type:complete
MRNLFLALRASLFYTGYALLTIWFCGTGVLFFKFLPYNIRSRYILGWNVCTIYWARCVLGLKFVIHGRENLPNNQSYVALSKHQSQWETYFLQYFLAPVCIVLKKELLKVPVFGWGLALVEPIAIDRSNPKQALKKIQTDGVATIAKGRNVLIFPEGTRINPGQTSNYARGGANIAVAAQAPIIPIAHNAGVYWPADKFLKYPGTIHIVIGQPIDTTDKTSREVNDLAKQWIESEVAKLPNQR